jgi:hypothetical protein
MPEFLFDVYVFVAVDVAVLVGGRFIVGYVIVVNLVAVFVIVVNLVAVFIIVVGNVVCYC